MTIGEPLPAPDDRPRAALIAGPTASGKSALAVALACALRDAGQDAVVINADASQVYADIPILSAQPTAAERKGIPHRLFGHVDGAQDYSAARWADEARTEIAAAHAARAASILVGGTGMYLTTLLNGIAPVPPIDDAIRAEIRALPVTEAYRRLQSADPHAAARLKPQDKARIARALEVVRSTGTPLHVWQQRREGGIKDQIRLVPQLLLPPREWLRARCDERLVRMFHGGFDSKAVGEVITLWRRKLDPALPVMRAIGVRELITFVDGGYDDIEEALNDAQAATRQYAKRQYTWFRHQLPDDWPRHIESLNHVDIDNLAIKLRDSVLTA
jgi:tRNA dimethylallyltransferase